MSSAFEIETEFVKKDGQTVILSRTCFDKFAKPPNEFANQMAHTKHIVHLLG